MFVGKKCFKIFEGVFLWPIFILDTFKGQKARFTSVFEQFTNDLQEVMTYLWRHR